MKIRKELGLNIIKSFFNSLFKNLKKIRLFLK